MELIRISDRKIKIMLTPSDMNDYAFDPERFEPSAQANGRAFRRLLAEVRRRISFETAERQITVQCFPSREGGCELFVCASVGNEGRKSANSPPPGALTVCEERQPTRCFRREGAFRFSECGILLRACKRLSQGGYRGESSAWLDDHGSYYILLTVVAASRFTLPREISVLSEYGEVAEPQRLRIWLGEHGRVICPSDAVVRLGALA